MLKEIFRQKDYDSRKILVSTQQNEYVKKMVKVTWDIFLLFVLKITV